MRARINSIPLLLFLCLTGPCAEYIFSQDASIHESDLSVSGFVNARFRSTQGDGEASNDLYQTLFLDIGNEKDNMFTFSFYARAIEDLDKLTEAPGFFVFEDINDTYKKSVNGYVYYAYMDINHRADSEGKSSFYDKIRIGRQFLSLIDFTHMDGVRLDLKEFSNFGKLCISLFGGMPVNRYESSSKDDWLYGFTATAKPFMGNLTTFEYLQISDRTNFYGIQRESMLISDSADFYGKQRASMFALSSRQIFSKQISINGRITFFENIFRDARVFIRYYASESDMIITLSLYGLFDTFEQSPVEFDTFTAVTDSLYPYLLGTVSLYKSLGLKFAVQGGATMRDLQDEDDETRFNREFSRYYITFLSRDYPVEHLDMSVTGEFWKSGDTKISSMGFNIDYRKDKKWKIGGGYYFSLYKINLFYNSEREQTGTFYLKSTYKINKKTDITGKLESETNEVDNFFTVSLAVKYLF